MAKPKNKTTKPPKKMARMPRAYLTTRILVRAAKAGVAETSRETIKLMGFNVVVIDDWVVRQYPDGRIEQISKISKTKPISGQILFD